MSMEFFRKLTRNLPTLVTAILLAVAVWILAVTNTDPVERRTYSRPVAIEITGQDPSLVVTSEIPEQVAIILSAPSSTWSSDLSASNAVRAILDLAGLSEGTYEIPVRLQIDARPVKVQSYTPDIVNVVLEKLSTEPFDINLVFPSSPAIGYDAGIPQLSAETATVSGPASVVERVFEVRATLDISQAKENIDRDIQLVALDENGLRLNGVAISPEKVNIKQEITQLGGYRNVIVKPLTVGQPALGYQINNISLNPPVVTLFSTDFDLITNLPGYIETQPLNLTAADEDLEVSLKLKLPSGVIVVGESNIIVSVSITPLEGSKTLSSIPIEIIGIRPEYLVNISPDSLDIILSGSLPKLEFLKNSNVRVLLDLTEYLPGIYQIEPQIQIEISGILVESVLPAVIEVEILQLPSPTPGTP